MSRCFRFAAASVFVLAASAAGLYNAVFRLVEALRLFPAAVLAVALPALCRANGSGPLARVTILVTLMGVALTTGLSWFPFVSTLAA